MHPEPLIVKVGPRELAVEDAGPDSGFPILMMNGAGSRHLFPPAVREGQEQGFRLIGYDRPGCGGSTSLPGRRIADCAGDIRTIMCELSISRAAVWGSSGGGHMRWPLRRSCRRSLPPERARAEFRKRSAVTRAERGWWRVGRRSRSCVTITTDGFKIQPHFGFAPCPYWLTQPTYRKRSYAATCKRSGTMHSHESCAEACVYCWSNSERGMAALQQLRLLRYSIALERFDTALRS